ncbi:MAG: hypothetical protein AABX71_01895 [Nanoarchaeota archaeon]
MTIKEFVKRHYIEIIIAVVVLLLFYGGIFIESRSEYVWGDYTNKSGDAILKLILSLLK